MIYMDGVEKRGGYIEGAQTLSDVQPNVSPQVTLLRLTCGVAEGRPEIIEKILCHLKLWPEHRAPSLPSPWPSWRRAPSGCRRRVRRVVATLQEGWQVPRQSGHFVHNDHYRSVCSSYSNIRICLIPYSAMRGRSLRLAEDLGPGRCRGSSRTR